MNTNKVGFKFWIIIFLLVTTMILFNPQQSIAKPQKFDGSKTYVTIWFDHAFSDQVPAVNAMMKYNMPGAILIRPGVIGNPNFMTWDELRYYNSKGFEMIDHSITHPLINNNTSQGTLVHEILFGKTLIQRQGIKVNGYIPPFDIVTKQSASLINQHFKYTVIPSVTENTPYTIANNGKVYGLNIPSLQHFGVGVNGPPLKNFTAAKQMIDYAIENHTWLILSYHQLDNKDLPFHTKMKLFMQILDYVQQKIVAKQMIAATPSQALGLD